jgi:hypothetical protein
MWHPDDEAEAASDLAAFIEYLRATRGNSELDPAELMRWAQTAPAEFDAALAEFYGESTARSEQRRAALFERWKAIRRPA